MNNTTNYGYNLPEYLEDADVVILNQNFTAIDKDILDVRQIAVLMYDSDETYNTDDLVGYENPTDHHIRMFRCLEDNVTGVWDSTKWTNTNVAAELLRRSGGGTEVEANPTGTATDTLVKIRIGNTIYAVSSGATALEDLTDVDLSNLTTGQILVWDGNDWVNSDPIGGASELSDLDDVSLTTPTEGQLLTYDGDEWVNADAPDVDVTKTAEGNPIEISDGANAPLVKCVTEIQGYQDLHGYDKPWVGGSGKNKLEVTATSQTINGVTFTINSDGTVSTSGTASADTTFDVGTFSASGGTSYVLNGCPTGGGLTAYLLSIAGVGYDSGSGYTYAPSADATVIIRITVYSGTNVSGKVFKPMIRLATETDPTFAPYSNICPITAYTEGEIEVSDGDGNTTTHTTTYPSAIYRGSEDVMNGEVTIQKIKWTRNSSTMNNAESYPGWNDSGIANLIGHGVSGRYTTIMSVGSQYVVNTLGNNDTLFLPTDAYGLTQTEWVALAVDIDIVIELPTPTTSSVTPTNPPIKSLSGYSHIESSTGEMEIEYITKKYSPIIEIAERETKTIDEMLTENIESSMTASQNYTTGELIIACGKIYRATANIASGSNLTVGTNIVATTIEAEIARSGGGVNYSTTEHVVGTWIDGSTIYEKTFSFSIPSNNYTTETTGITNFDKCVGYSGIVALGNGYFEDINYGRPDSPNSTYYIAITSTGDIFFKTYETSSGTAYITMRYTKSS